MLADEVDGIESEVEVYGVLLNSNESVMYWWYVCACCCWKKVQRERTSLPLIEEGEVCSDPDQTPSSGLSYALLNSKSRLRLRLQVYLLPYCCPHTKQATTLPPSLPLPSLSRWRTDCLWKSGGVYAWVTMTALMCVCCNWNVKEETNTYNKLNNSRWYDRRIYDWMDVCVCVWLH